MNTVLSLGIIITSFIILYFAYFTKSELAKLIVYILLAGILTRSLFSILSGIDFLDFLRNAFNVLRSLVIFIEIVLIAFLMFFKFSKKNNIVFKVATILLLVFLLLVELDVF